MKKDEIEKRMNAAVDILAFLNERIEQQVELQVEKRLVQEREFWRRVIASLITKEVSEFVKEVGESVRMSHDEMINRVQQMLDRAEAKLAEPMHRCGDDAPPSPSKH